LSSGAGEEQAVNAIADVAEIGFIAALELDGGAAGETDLTEGLAHGAPVHVALAEVHPRVTVFLALEIFQMDLDDALAERANPILGIAIKHDVAHVEPGLDPLAVKLVYVGGHFLNKFLLSPLEMAAYIDEFHSQWIKSWFDVGNVVLYGYPQDWIRTLGKRIIKVHLKDFKRKENGYAWVNLGEGDVDWRAVRQAFG